MLRGAAILDGYLHLPIQRVPGPVMNLFTRPDELTRR